MKQYRLAIHSGVHDEVVEASVYYNDQQSGLGEDLLLDWEYTINKIVRLPEGYQKKKKQFREALLQRFPYVVIFEVTETEVYIYRFINVKRHPGKRYTKRKK